MTIENSPGPAGLPRRLTRSVVRLTLAACDLYLLWMMLYFILREIIGEAWWAIILTSQFLHWFLLPAIVLLFVMLLLRRWIPAGLAMISILAFIVLFGHFFLPPKTYSAPPNAPTVTVATFNIASYATEPEPIAEEILKLDADIIALQEVDEEAGRVLDELLAEAYPYRVLHTTRSITAGKGLLSKYPITDYEVFLLSTTWRYSIQATIEIEGQPIQVFVTHPSPPGFGKGGKWFGPDPDTEPEIQMLLGQRVDTSLPTVLLGDFNMVDQSELYQQINEAGLTDVFREIGYGMGLTFPANGGPLVGLPLLVRIDYIWITDHFIPLDVWVGADTGSDHLPLLARIALSPR